MKKKSAQIVIFILVLALTGCSWQNVNETKGPAKKPGNIILFIGDGMGVAQLYTGMTVSDHPFFLEGFPFSGFSKTYSYDNYITDSGAGGTAIACGIKTKNGMIGMGPDSTAVMVPIFSYGPGAEKFSGIHENTFFLEEFLNLLNIKK